MVKWHEVFDVTTCCKANLVLHFKQYYFVGNFAVALCFIPSL